jgi:hypothetical protein
VEGFVQQLAVGYLARGYRFYASCRIPTDKDPVAVDQKLIERYGLDLSKWTRARRKQQGIASVQYLRYGRFFVLIATPGQHPFFEREPHWKDIRDHPIRFAGYSIGCRTGHDGRLHASVRLHDECLRRLRQRYLRCALHPNTARLAASFQALRFAPYAPVRRQLLKLLWCVNGRRKAAGLELISVTALRLRRRPVSPFLPPSGAADDQRRTVTTPDDRRAGKPELEPSPPHNDSCGNS